MQRMLTRQNDVPSKLNHLAAKRGGSSIENHMRGFRWLAAITIIFAAANEFSESVTDTRYTNCEREPVSLEKVLRVLRAPFPSMRVVTAGSQEYGPPDYTHVGPESITSVAQRAYNAVFSSQRTNEEVDDNEQGVVKVVRYMRNYRLSIEEASTVSKEILDCNDYTQCTCEALAAEGIPSYMVSTWANNPKDGFENWHIFTVCKMNDHLFVIVDNGGIATVWHGTLASFLEQYRTEGPEDSPNVRIVPLGISRYTESEYNDGFGFCKLASQVREAASVPDERSMVSVGENNDTLVTRSY